MTRERWLQLELDPTAKLTPEELKEGWHFCYDWDEMVVGPGMSELDACTCGGGTPHD